MSIFSGDADTSIVSKVLAYANDEKNVELIATDTDLLVMLVFFWKKGMGRIIMKTEASKKVKANEREIGKVAECLGDIKKYITFIHAFGGCDTTSSIYGKGKTSILRLLEKSKDARQEADIFLKENCSPQVICTAGTKLFVQIYGGKSSDSLDELRYLNYMKMSLSSANIKPENLPPTQAAANYHIRRTYYQTQEWNTLMKTTLDPEDWGWKLEKGSFVPVMTDKEPAPPELLNVIRCNCRITTNNPCGGKKCSCRSNGLHCVIACGDCRGTECQNSSIVTDILESDDEIESENNDNYVDIFDK